MVGRAVPLGSYWGSGLQIAALLACVGWLGGGFVSVANFVAHPNGCGSARGGAHPGGPPPLPRAFRALAAAFPAAAAATTTATTTTTTTVGITPTTMATATVATAVWLDGFALVRSSVGFGVVGLGGSLGFEGRCVSVAAHNAALRTTVAEDARGEARNDLGGVAAAAAAAHRLPRGNSPGGHSTHGVEMAASAAALATAPARASNNVEAATGPPSFELAADEDATSVQAVGDAGAHSVALHPPAFGAAFAEFDLSSSLASPAHSAAARRGHARGHVRGPLSESEAARAQEAADVAGGGSEGGGPTAAAAASDAAWTPSDETATGGAVRRRVWLSGSVGINDGNNAFGRAGSQLVFAAVDGYTGVDLWTSRGIQTVGDYAAIDPPVEVTALSRGVLRLEVRAGSNACAHAVWIDPIVVTEVVPTAAAATAPGHDLRSLLALDHGGGDDDDDDNDDSGGASNQTEGTASEAGSLEASKVMARTRNGSSVRDGSATEGRWAHSYGDVTGEVGGVTIPTIDLPAGGGALPRQLRLSLKDAPKLSARDATVAHDLAEKRDQAARASENASGNSAHQVEAHMGKRGNASAYRKDAKLSAREAAARKAFDAQESVLPAVPDEHLWHAKGASGGTAAKAAKAAAASAAAAAALAAPLAPPSARDTGLDHIATFIMGTTNAPKDPWINWYSRVVPSLRTWAPAFKHVFIVLPHDAHSLRFVSNHNCASMPQHLSKNRWWHHEYSCPEWTSEAAFAWHAAQTRAAAAAMLQASEPEEPDAGASSSGQQPPPRRMSTRRRKLRAAAQSEQDNEARQWAKATHSPPKAPQEHATGVLAGGRSSQNETLLSPLPSFPSSLPFSPPSPSSRSGLGSGSKHRRLWARSFEHFEGGADDLYGHDGAEFTVGRLAGAPGHRRDEYDDNGGGPRVILTAHRNFNCSDEYRGDGPCCKANFALWYMLSVRRSLLNQVKWVAFLDDDVYLQPQMLADALGKVDATAKVAVVPTGKCFRKPFHHTEMDPEKRASDLFPVNCDLFWNDSYWAHPAWLSVPAVKDAFTGIVAGGIRQQCGVLGTSHETALGQFLWMHGVGCAGMANSLYSAQGDVRPGLAVVHRARPRMTDVPPPWDQKTTPLHLIPPSALKMHTVHNALSSASFGSAAEAEAKEMVSSIKFPSGYSRTPHAKDHDIRRRWAMLDDAGCTDQRAKSPVRT